MLYKQSRMLVFTVIVRADICSKFVAVEISADVIDGNLDIIANGGNGHKGQDGGDGAVGANRQTPVSKAKQFTYDSRFH